MTTSIVRRCLAATGRSMAVLALVFIAQPAGAQTHTASDMDWQHGTTLFGFGGAQSASSRVSGGAGLGFGWEVTRQFALEGRGTWFQGTTDTPDFAATLAAHVPLAAARKFRPFATGGIGMYRATVDPSSSTVPDFYRLRMDDGITGRRTFQDFLTTVGGGVDVHLSNHWAVRPEANMMFVITGSDYRPMGVYGVQVVYHVESHPIE